MSKDYFKGLIKCMECGKNYNFRDEHGTKVFVCSTAKNYGRKSCPNSPRINMDRLLFIIEQHCKIHNKDYDITKTKLFVRKIEVEPDKITIFYKDGTKSIKTKNEIIF